MRSDSARIGREFEKAIQAMADRYCAQGLLRLRKVDPPMRIVGGRVIMLENPHLDFVGSWTERGGRMLVVEAKVTQDGRLPVNVKSGGLTLSQMKAISGWWFARAIVIVLWRYDEGVRLLRPGRLAGRCVHQSNGETVPVTPQGWPDFLPVLRKIYPA